MKKIFFFSFFLFSTAVLSFAQQTIQPDSRLKAKYTDAYLQELTVMHPEKVEYLNFCLDNGFQIIEIADEKAEGLPYLRFFNGKEIGDIVEDFPDGAFNLALYSYERAYDTKTTYRLLSGKAIVFDSAKRVTELFNDVRNEQ
jgi:hypothetical protein